jgi:hypothetical protein
VSADPLTTAIQAERQRRGEPPATKRCTACGEDKPVDDFAPDPRRLNGRGRVSQCHGCTAARVHQWRIGNPEARARTQLRSAAHSAALRELGRRHRDEFRRLYAAELSKVGMVPERLRARRG